MNVTGKGGQVRAELLLELSLGNFLTPTVGTEKPAETSTLNFCLGKPLSQEGEKQ